ncbi:uncharacterized protein LOC144325693 [Podarcis muralis]
MIQVGHRGVVARAQPTCHRGPFPPCSPAAGLRAASSRKSRAPLRPPLPRRHLFPSPARARQVPRRCALPSSAAAAASGLWGSRGWRRRRAEPHRAAGRPVQIDGLTPNSLARSHSPGRWRAAAPPSSFGSSGPTQGRRRPRPGWNPAAGTPRGARVPGSTLLRQRRLLLLLRRRVAARLRDGDWRRAPFWGPRAQGRRRGRRLLLLLLLPPRLPLPPLPRPEEGSAAVLPPLLRARCCCRRLRARRRCALTPRKQQRQQRAPCSAQAPSSLPASSSAANRRPPQRRPLRRARQSPGTWPAPASQSPHQPPAPARSQRSSQGKAGRRGGRLPADTAWPRPPSRGRGVPTRAAASSARAPPPHRPTCLLGSPVAPLVRPIALFPPAQVPICFSHPSLDVSGAGAPSLLASAAPRASPRGLPRGEEKRLEEVYLARLRPSPAPQILPLLFPWLFLALSHNGLAVTLVGHQQHPPPPPLPFERLFLCCIQSPREIFHIQVTGSTCQSPSTRSRPHRPESLCFLPIYFAQKFLG